LLDSLLQEIRPSLVNQDACGLLQDEGG